VYFTAWPFSKLQVLHWPVARASGKNDVPLRDHGEDSMKTITIGKCKAAWSSILLVLLLGAISACEKTDENGRPAAFFNASSYDGKKRIPLAFPFEIGEFGNRIELRKWGDYELPTREVDIDSLPAYRILRFSQTNDYVFGECDKGWVCPSGELQYFVFSLSQTNVIRFSDQTEFVQHCATFGGNVNQMCPFEEQWRAYWEQHDKRNR
jgi:hypothetical protein